MNFRQFKLACSVASLSAAILTVSGVKAQAQTQSNNLYVEKAPEKVAQFSPGRTTRSGPSYLGVGGFVSFDDNSSFGDGAFSVISKIGLSRNFSIRPSALINDDPVFLIPLTIDFPVDDVANTGIQRLSVAPYLGAGVSINTDNDADVGFLLTGGVDVPVSQRITATGGVNIGFSDDNTDVGLLLGVGYNF
ncbi:MAG: hypothetical protein HC836_15105 [Richelia sp. RM2_1_2]|nr:hypothetical protein [Richelia sp. SM2_1_7]NJM17854.1 hypothetical protein [Richelia sp. SM1_7_0]NJN09518.1 hypothetical protein [Richelia sp. RM1_1_1]NJO27237.1 hypothetical protein [Richelia sp. SL_2_1]NJO59574.1 hypothetical protein [Richelia sp. RM2_1_2]NJS16042.1 hypothetical protein [Nostocaceae cyanobacterium CSU_2_110]